MCLLQRQGLKWSVADEKVILASMDVPPAGTLMGIFKYQELE